MQLAKNFTLVFGQSRYRKFSGVSGCEAYLRLLGLLLLIVLLNGAGRRLTAAAPEWFRCLNQQLAPRWAGFSDDTAPSRARQPYSRVPTSYEVGTGLAQLYPESSYGPRQKQY